MARRRNTQRGFSLIEIIVIVVVAGFLSVLVLSLLGTQLTKSGKALFGAQQAGEAEAAMEAVVAYYAQRVNTNLSTALSDVQTQYAGNATVSLSSTTLSKGGVNNVAALVVTVSAGDSQYTTVLTQERNNAADANVAF